MEKRERRNPPEGKVQGKRYTTGTSVVRVGKTTYLYRTPEGTFYMARQDAGPEEQESIGPLSLEEAIRLFRKIGDPDADFEEAFPGVTMWK